MYFLLIVNKNGSLIFDKAFTNNIKLSSNEIINIAAIFYSMHAISSKLTPVNIISFKHSYLIRLDMKKHQN